MTTDQQATPAARDGDLSHFGYDAQLRRSLTLGDLLVYGLVFIVPIAPFAIFGIVFNASKGMVPLTYLIGLVAMVFTAHQLPRDVGSLSDRGLGLRVRRPRPPSVGRLSRGLGHPARLSPHPDAVLRGWRRRHARGAAVDPAAAMGDRLSDVQHGGQHARDRDHRAREPDLSGHGARSCSRSSWSSARSR